MTLDRARLKEQIHELYRNEHVALGERGTLERLERGREWDLAPTLAAGGVAVFPHAGVFDCGHQVAAVVHGCLDAGADRVVVISVSHAFTDEMDEARRRGTAGTPRSVP
jgi:predicted class III extradiol MEMO1 family dioxygenase